MGQPTKLIQQPPRGNIVVPNNSFDASILEAADANMAPGATQLVTQLVTQLAGKRKVQ